jgi:hypothetical protein
MEIINVSAATIIPQRILMMNKKIVFSVMLVAIFAFGFVIVSCGGDTSKLVGIWVAEDNEYDSIELLKDKTGMRAKILPFTWVAENNRLSLTFSLLDTQETIVMDYKLSGSTLALTYEGETTVFKKKNTSSTGTTDAIGKSSNKTDDSANGNEVTDNTKSDTTSIVINDPLDIPFLHKDPRIKMGKTYEVTLGAWYNTVHCTTLFINLEPKQITVQALTLGLTSRIKDFNKGEPVRVVFLYKPTEFIDEPSFMNSELVSIDKQSDAGGGSVSKSNWEYSAS